MGRQMDRSLCDTEGHIFILAHIRGDSRGFTNCRKTVRPNLAIRFTMVLLCPYTTLDGPERLGATCGETLDRHSSMMKEQRHRAAGGWRAQLE